MDLKAAAESAVAETFESMVFMDVVPVSKQEADIQAQGRVWSCIDVKSPLKTRLSLIIPEDLAREITFDILGFEDEGELSMEMLVDVMAELINTIAGRFVAKVTPEDETFELGLPESGSGEPDTNPEAMQIFFEADDFFISLFIQS